MNNQTPLLIHNFPPPRDHDPLWDFYKFLMVNSEGVSYLDIIGADDEWLEHNHMWVQWMFPLPEPSSFNIRAPALTLSILAAMRKDSVVQDRIMVSFRRFKDFLGLDDLSKIHPRRAYELLIIPNHNWLRITRMLKSLGLLVMQNQNNENDKVEIFNFYDFWIQLAMETQVPERTLGYWREAGESWEVNDSSSYLP